MAPMESRLSLVGNSRSMAWLVVMMVDPGDLC